METGATQAAEALIKQARERVAFTRTLGNSMTEKQERGQRMAK